MEEQFYLLWFLIVMVLPSRLLLPVSISFLALANLFRITVFVTGASFYLVVLLPGVCDGLAVGSIIAIVLRDERLSFFKSLLQNRCTFYVCSAGLVGMLITPFTNVPGFQPVMWIWMTFFAGIVVLEAIAPKPTMHLNWLNAAPLRHIGKISYGIYIWHYFVGQAIAKMDPTPYWEHSIGGKIALILGSFAASFLIAQASWLAIEQPVLSLKKRSESFLRPIPNNGEGSDGLAVSGSLRPSGP